MVTGKERDAESGLDYFGARAEDAHVFFRASEQHAVVADAQPEGASPIAMRRIRASGATPQTLVTTDPNKISPTLTTTYRPFSLASERPPLTISLGGTTMSTQSQIDANRENSKKSTGPTSPEGKATSSQNGAKHRLTMSGQFQVLDHENQSDFEDLFAQLHHGFAIKNPIEKALIRRMAEHEWIRRRAVTFQSVLFDKMASAPNFESQLKLFMRYESQHERAYNACLAQLLKLRVETRSEKIGFERQTQKTQHLEAQKKRHQLDADCKIIRTMRTVSNNPEALALIKEAKTRYQAA